MKNSTNTNLSSNLVNFSGKFNKFLSSLIWIETLLDSNTDHYKGEPLQSWHYNRFNAITDLDPTFLEAYKYGGLFLSVIKDDIPAATELYKKGIAKFPQNYHLNLYGALHFITETNNYEIANLYLDTIKKKHPTNPLIKSLYYSTKLKSIGDKALLRNEILKDPINPQFKKFLLKKLKL